MIIARPYKMSNPIQHYAWGSKGKTAFIPQFIGIKSEDIPYAELWMGAHPKSSSKLLMDNNEYELGVLINKYSLELLGSDIQKKYNMTFPFLAKILSIEDVLSIQLHPDKQNAIQLHLQDSEHYPDDNHKPEIAIALDSLTAVFGFQSKQELENTFSQIPCLLSMLFAEKIFEKYEENEINLYLIKRLNDLANNSKQLESLLLHLDIQVSNWDSEVGAIYKKARRQYGTDIGLIYLFLMNLIKLQEGEAVYIDAGVPHAYISGNIIECMANSDNVVRAGLTPKFKDPKTLMKIIDLKASPTSIIHFSKQQKIKEYKVPADEFKVTVYNFENDNIYIDTNNKPEICLVLEGEIILEWEEGESTDLMHFHRGESIFIPAILLHYKIKAEKPARFVRFSIP